jgi:hypothetical protein
LVTLQIFLANDLRILTAWLLAWLVKIVPNGLGFAKGWDFLAELLHIRPLFRKSNFS